MTHSFPTRRSSDLQDVRRGLINAAEAEAARREIERRLLQTDAPAGATSATTGGAGPRRLALAVVVALPVLGLGLYLQLGTPDLPDMPLADRDPGGPEEVALLTGRLEARVADNPRSEEHTSELQSLMRISYAVFCL